MYNNLEVVDDDETRLYSLKVSKTEVRRHTVAGKSHRRQNLLRAGCVVRLRNGASLMAIASSVTRILCGPMRGWS
ncbi:hypothetical protein PanWU01x14_209660 [Parasponia andersonii]|uniref:Uncharacterized protein n=1 Tax=Parasponia andersonii TaxID=3476 RepID=A0A2P5BUA4_PARAD|nr:hypothetical protein PanWU01x14_209660 [Parasponia andersonii]